MLLVPAGHDVPRSSDIGPGEASLKVHTVVGSTPIGGAKEPARVILPVALAIVLLSLALQCVIQPSGENIASSAAAAFASIVTFTYLYGPSSVAESHPLSTLALLGFNVSSLSGALVYQSVTLTPLVENLAVPLKTFGYLALLQLVLLTSHAIYSRFPYLRSLARTLSSGVCAPLGLLDMPRSSQLWLLGMAGLAATWFGATTAVAYGDVVGKSVVALMLFAYAPFIIPFLNRTGTVASRRPALGWSLVAFGLALVFVAMARNSRATFVMGLATPILVMYLGYISGALRLTRRAVFVVFVCLLTAVMVFGLLSDLATAMLLVRGQRSQVKGRELVELTWDQFTDRGGVRAYREYGGVNGQTGYNERYISNPIIARLVTVKFDDNMLRYEELLTPSQKDEVRRLSLEKAVATLPTPVLRMLGIDLDKSLLEYSMGDLIYSRVSSEGLGGYRVGSITAHGLIIFGPWFYLVVLIGAPIVFVVFDALARYADSGIRLAPFALIFAYSLWDAFEGDSGLQLFGLLVRGLPQSILLYIVVLKLTAILLPARSQKS